MKGPRVRRVRAADLRRMAAVSAEPERQRKMLVLAEELEERDAELVVRSDDPAGR
jgi:hypothetical protein